MTTVPLEEHPQRLDEVVNRSRNGEHILITSQGSGIVELSPVGSAGNAIGALRKAGKVAWSGGKPQGLRDVEIQGKPVSETVLEDRR
jgi:antitoxin (DNA-binding transcriptional repressor) of toxin-antitoxin stability system